MPLNNPIIAPINKPNIIPRNTFPSLTIEAITTALNAKIEPTERSIPPLIITKVIPKPKIAVIETCLKTLTIFEILKKLSANIESKINKTINPTKAGFFS